MQNTLRVILIVFVYWRFACLPIYGGQGPRVGYRHSCFYPIPVFGTGYCRCLRLSVCLCACCVSRLLLVHSITQQPFQLASSCFAKKMRNIRLIYPLILVLTSQHQNKNSTNSSNHHIWFKRSLIPSSMWIMYFLILVLIYIDLQGQISLENTILSNSRFAVLHYLPWVKSKYENVSNKINWGWLIFFVGLVGGQGTRGGLVVLMENVAVYRSKGARVPYQ